MLPSPSDIQAAVVKSPLVSLPLAAASAVGYGPLVALARSSVLGLFSRLQVGVLTIEDDADGSVKRFGDAALISRLTASDSGNDNVSRAKASTSSTPQDLLASRGIVLATLRVRKDTFWLRMLFGADLGFSEAYMASEVDTPSLGDCFDLFIRNREALGELDLGLTTRLTGWVQGQLNKRYANTKGGSLKNIGAHYDISNAMYERFLSRDMTYSCGIFPSLDADLPAPLDLSTASSLLDGHRNGTSSSKMTAPSLSHDSGIGSPGSESSLCLSPDPLEDSQMRKLRLHITRCGISPGDRVLEIGTGWGSLALETCRQVPGVKIETLTLSKEQKALAEARIKEAGLQKQIRVHLLDYRDMPAEWAGSFDRVVSIEMLEAVGIEFLTTYFAAIHRVLKPDVGTAVFQCITMPECRFDAYVRGVDFIKKYIFPGGVLPSVSSLVNGMTEGSKGTMVLQSVDSIGPHYARTLREWRRKFEASFDVEDGIRQALLRDHDAIRALPASQQDVEVEVFRRKWLYYFIYCERGFAENQIGDHIMTFARVGAPVRTQPISYGGV
ncbi:unnamed protein product [Parajaminaea phylloscopi]